MTASEKIELWIQEQEAAGMSQDEIVKCEFIHVDSDGDIWTFRLSKSGKRYNLKSHIGALDIDKWEPKKEE